MDVGTDAQNRNMSQKSFYARYLLPRLTDLTMSRKLLLLYRQRVVTKYLSPRFCDGRIIKRPDI